MLKGNLIMSTVRASHEEDFVEIKLTDNNSSVRVVTIKMTHAEWAKSLQSSFGECSFEATTKDVGLHKETKHVFVPHGDAKYHRGDLEITKKVRFEEQVEPFEVDGWVGQISSFYNHHNHATVDGAKGSNTLFTRHVAE
jgi:hypothetical protein